jgi:sporulation protein YlmC with PRC-barrel domain
MNSDQFDQSDQEVSSRRLERLSRMREYDVAPKEPDPRGWTVVSRDGRTIGEVRDLLIDTDRMTATYLDVALDRRRFGLRDGDDSHVLVPVERAHQAGKRLLVEEITRPWLDEVRAARDAEQREFWDRWWRRA